MKPLILVTNDDGIYSKGIHSIINVAMDFGDVVVVAPDKPQSGMGHAITINNPLRLNEVNLIDGVRSYSSSGTPVDCVKLGIFEVLDKKPDLLISGVNHGENTSTNVLYSGTMSAAIEGAMEGIPSLGFSLADFDSDADFKASSIIEIYNKIRLENAVEEVTFTINIINKVPISSFKDSLMHYVKERNIKLGSLMKSLRFALVGNLTGPDLFDIINLLDKKECIKRLNNYIEFLKGLA